MFNENNIIDTVHDLWSNEGEGGLPGHTFSLLQFLLHLPRHN